VGSRIVTDLLYRREVKIPQLLGEGEPGKGGQQICHKVMVRHIVAVKLKPLHTKVLISVSTRSGSA
jgi:hypothetical protein